MRTSDRERWDARPAATPRRLRLLALVALTALAAIAGLQAAVPDRAQAITGLERTYKSTDKDYEPAKVAIATCPNDKLVIGGGAQISDGNSDIARFTALEPRNTSPSSFWAVAQAVFNGQYEPWSLTAYAICADMEALDDYEIAVRTFDNPNSANFLQATAACPSETVAYSAGGGIRDYSTTFKGRIGLQMVRTDGALGIGRLTARENTPLDTPNPWQLQARAVCAKPQQGIHVEGLGDLDGDQEVTSFCNDPSTYVHGAGGGASGPGITDAGRSWLKEIVPSHALRSMRVKMAGPEAPRGGVVAHHTCAR